MKLIFAYPGNERIAKNIAAKLNYQLGDVVFRHFPDGESYIKINSEIKDHDLILVCSLDHPNDKILSLLFFSEAAKELGARKIGLVAPYLAYMRQDKRFNPGEAITSNYFGKLLSHYFDWLVTIDPHLHRHSSLDEVYGIPTVVMHAVPLIAEWIAAHADSALLIGPDSESAQWVCKIAKQAHTPCLVLEKQRLGDDEVKVSQPDVSAYQNHQPILIDDIISTGRTMIETVMQLQAMKMKAPIIIGVHAIFADNAYAELQASSVKKIITCNTIAHSSNSIDVSDLLAEAIRQGCE